MNRVNSMLSRPLLSALLVVSLAGLGSATATPARAAGGAFTATYAGIFTFIGCPSGLGCTLILTGGGPATFLGQSHETTVITLTKISIPCVQVAGTSALTSTVSSGDAVTASFTGTLCLRYPAIKGLAFLLNYTITGGTGAYSGATGAGTISGAMGFDRVYKDTWQGTLTYP